MVQLFRVRNLCEGEDVTLPLELRDTGMAYLIPEWTWIIETVSPLRPFVLPTPFAIIVASQAHSWLVLWRVLALSPLPPGMPLTWFLEAIPQVFAVARQRGCVGFLTLLADNRPEEVKMARIIQRMAGAAIMPFQGSLGAGSLVGIAEERN